MSLRTRSVIHDITFHFVCSVIFISNIVIILSAHFLSRVLINDHGSNNKKPFICEIDLFTYFHVN